MVYTRKISEEELQLVKKSNKYLAGGGLGNLNSQVIIRRGAGSRIWDVSGNEYIDYLLGSGPMIVGHAHPEVVSFVQEQIGRGTTFFATNEYAILLAEEIVDAVPCAEKVRFATSGSEATLYAMRVARAYNQKAKILKFEGGFHGMNDYSLMSMAPSAPIDFPFPVPDSAGIPNAVESDVLIAPFNDIVITSNIIEQYCDDLAAVIVEPLQRVIPPIRGFLEGLREVTKQYKIPLIFDEIVTGFRLSYGGAQEYYGVVPDLCVLGKSVAGGFPLTVIAGNSELMSCFDSSAVNQGQFVPQVGTLSGNPVASLGGLATLKILKAEGTYQKLFDTGRRVMESLQSLLDQASIPAQVIGEAPVFDLYFTDNEITNYRATIGSDKDKLKLFNRLLLDKGVFKGDSKYYVSTAHTDKDVTQTIDAFIYAIEQIKDS